MESNRIVREVRIAHDDIGSSGCATLAHMLAAAHPGGCLLILDLVISRQVREGRVRSGKVDTSLSPRVALVNTTALQIRPRASQIRRTQHTLTDNATLCYTHYCPV